MPYLLVMHLQREMRRKENCLRSIPHLGRNHYLSLSAECWECKYRFNIGLQAISYVDDHLICIFRRRRPNRSILFVVLFQSSKQRNTIQDNQGNQFE